MALQIDIQLGDKPTIKVTGREITALKEEQLKLLGGRSKLEYVIEERFGRRADGVRLDAETTPGHIRDWWFKRNWQPAHMETLFSGGRILDNPTELEAIVTSPAYNIDHDTPSHVLVELSRDKTNSVSKETQWNIGSSVSQSFTAEIEGGVDLGIKVGGKVSGTSSMSLSAGYGESKGKQEAVTIGSKAGITVDLEPMDATICTLPLNVGKLVAEATSNRNITGGVLAHFGKRVLSPGQSGKGNYIKYVPSVQPVWPGRIETKRPPPHQVRQLLSDSHRTEGPQARRDTVLGGGEEGGRAASALGGMRRALRFATRTSCASRS